MSRPVAVGNRAVCALAVVSTIPSAREVCTLTSTKQPAARGIRSGIATDVITPPGCCQGDHVIKR